MQMCQLVQVSHVWDFSSCGSPKKKKTKTNTSVAVASGFIHWDLCALSFLLKMNHFRLL